MVVVQSCSQSGATYGICHMLKPFVSHVLSYQHDKPDLALHYGYVCNIGGSCTKSYCGAT